MYKKIFSVILIAVLALLLASCEIDRKTILVDPPKSKPTKEVSTPISAEEKAQNEAFLNDFKAMVTNSDAAKYSHVEIDVRDCDVKVAFNLPDDWIYESVEDDGLRLKLKPKNEGSGSVTIVVLQQFAVCGTGLTSEDVIFNGHEAWKGTYDHHPFWDFIHLKDLRGCAILNETEGWYTDHYDGISFIMNSIIFESTK